MSLQDGADEFGEIDPAERSPIRRPRRWSRLAMASGVLVIGATLALWQPWRGSSSGNGGVDTLDTAPSSLTEQLVIDLPGLQLDSSSLPGPPSAGAVPDRGFVFTAAAASMTDGPMLALVVTELIDDKADPSPVDSVDINGTPAIVQRNGQSVEVIWEGEPGLQYGAVGAGMPEARVIAFARAVSFDGGITTVSDPSVLDGLQPAGDIEALVGLVDMAQPLAFGGGGEVTGVRYLDEDGSFVTVASIRARPADLQLLAGLLIDGEQATTVGDAPGVVGELDADLREGDGQRMIVWQQDDRVIAVVATTTVAHLRDLAAAVRPATSDEWDDVVAAVFNGSEFVTDEVGSAPGATSDPTQP
ncbi:MAG: hypothetical protein WCC60_07830 [Ilumatobacteraceae bacterium]